jgi:ribosome-binding ATPase YchF (GTP1/OBG family)
MEQIGAGRAVRTLELTETEREIANALQLLTDKPVFYVANVAEEALADLGSQPELLSLERRAAAEGAQVIALCASLEAQIAELAPEERPEFLELSGLSEPGLERVVRAGYELLGLITFFTGNAKECHAWTIPSGTTAAEAAGTVHTDFQKGFIKAEVIHWETLTSLGSEARVREAGRLAVHGRDYVVQDGDVMYVRFRV